MKTKLYIFFTLATLVVAGAIFERASMRAAAQSGTTSAHIISTSGTLSAGGQYTQTTGNFFRMEAGPTPTPVPSPSPVASPTPTATPVPSPTPCVPSPGSPGGSLYVGSYVLSNGEGGSFILSSENGSNTAAGSGAPEELPENAVFVEEGPATITLQVNPTTGTGAGTISFASGEGQITGTITIFLRVPVPPTDPVICGGPTPTPTPAVSPTPTPTPAASPTPSPTPPPATAEVAGRVTTPAGQGLRNAVVMITDSVGAKRTVTTSSFGLYRFENVKTNEAYVVSVSSKRYRFTSQLIAVSGSIADLDLVGQE